MSTKPVKGVRQELGTPGQIPGLPRKASATKEILRVIVICVLLIVIPLLLGYAVIRLLFGPITIE
jgi:hypothetical protein